MTGKKNIEEVLHVLPVVSTKMEQSIKLWDDMYKGQAEWLHEPTIANPIDISSLGLAASIASEKARTATLEMQSRITDPAESTADKIVDMTEDFVPLNRAEYLNKQYQLYLLPHIRRQLEYGIAKGGLVIKPYIYDNDKIHFSFCQADDFYPISFDPTGRMTEAAFTEVRIQQKIKYTRLEYHKLDVKNKTVTVVNKAFRTMYSDAMTSDALGTEVPLSTLADWATISPSTTINNVDRLLFAYFKMPEANTIDPKSPLGVSGYSRCVSLIKEADLQFSRLKWEYDGGQLAVDVDGDALKTAEVTVDGKLTRVELPNVLQKRLFRKMDLGTDQTYNVYAPALRDASYINGLNNILMRIEDTAGISRGTFSDITRSEAKTATELLVMRQRTYSSNCEIQKALQAALEDVVYVMNVYATIFSLAPEGPYQTSYEWDDSLINNPEEELQRRIVMLSKGLESKVNIRMWYFGETKEQAMAALMQIEEEQMRNAEMQAIATGLVQQQKPQNEPNNKEPSKNQPSNEPK